MDNSRGYLLFARQDQTYKVRIADIRRLYKLNKVEAPRIPSFKNSYIDAELISRNFIGLKR